MDSLPDWMRRDHPAYDPNRIGAISQAQVMAALVEAGKIVLIPTVNVKAYDLVIEDEGRFLRVQCKTGRLFRGAVCFRPHRLRAARRETGWVRRTKAYNGDVDCFGVYCPETRATYLVPIGDVTGKRACTLRLTPAKNQQSRRIRWARTYEILPAVADAHEELTTPTGLINKGP